MFRRPALAAAALIVAVAIPVASSGARSTGHASATRRCHTEDLAGSFKAGSPGAGQRFATLYLRNASGHTCHVFGYVGGQLKSGGGANIATNILRDHTVTPHTITLKPGKRAKALFHWAAIPGTGEPQTGNCEPRPAEIRVTPPDETTQLVLRWRFGSVCQHGAIDVRPLRKG